MHIGRRRVGRTTPREEQKLGCPRSELYLFEIDLLVGLGSEQQDFIRKRFLRRHLYEHTSGVVDAEYMRLSGENDLRIGQVIRESHSNVTTLIDLCYTMAKNFTEGFDLMNLPSKMSR